jgi:hypothetical protein
VILVLLDQVLEVLERNFLVLNNQVDLELLDTETYSRISSVYATDTCKLTDGNESGSAPDETFLLNGTNVGLQLLHVCLIIPWLDVQCYDRLSSWLWSLSGLLGIVLLESLSRELSLLSILFLVIRSEEIDVLIVLSGWGSSRGLGGDIRAVGSEWKRSISWERRELLNIGGDVRVPTGSVWVLSGIWSGGDGLVDSNISLGWVESVLLSESNLP